MKIPSWYFGTIPRILEWRHKNKSETTILGHFLGILEIIGGGKGTPDHKYGKKYLVDILPPQQSGQLCVEIFFFHFCLVWEIFSLL